MIEKKNEENLINKGSELILTLLKFRCRLIQI